MDDILDEKIEQKELFQAIPLVIYLFMTAVFIHLLGNLFIIQSWPHGRSIRTVGTLAIVVTGLLSLHVFKEKKDRLLNIYCFVFLFGGIVKLTGGFIAYDHPLRFVLNLGERFFFIGVLFTLTRYFTLRKKGKTSLKIILYPLFVVVPMWIIGVVFKMQSWPYASEILTISVPVFLLGTIIMSMIELRKEALVLRLITAWLVLMVNLLIIGCLFKIQAWPYASELINGSFLGGTLGFVFKLIQEQKILKQQAEEIRNND
jgi:hypothetical protein